MLFMPSPKLIYVESFARVSSLSLSGKLLRPIVDDLIVQWPDLAKEVNRQQGLAKSMRAKVQYQNLFL